eukprot:GILK01003261.1.p1 GENE.GILK01003261.1~~GILK01003261.1.p1  ORF type:complete len:956 (-),score=108.89 GILK01003261.1:978-3809(-)
MAMSRNSPNSPKFHVDEADFDWVIHASKQLYIDEMPDASFFQSTASPRYIEPHQADLEKELRETDDIEGMQSEELSEDSAKEEHGKGEFLQEESFVALVADSFFSDEEKEMERIPSSIKHGGQSSASKPNTTTPSLSSSELNPKKKIRCPIFKECRVVQHQLNCHIWEHADAVQCTHQSCQEMTESLTRNGYRTHCVQQHGADPEITTPRNVHLVCEHFLVQFDCCQSFMSMEDAFTHNCTENSNTPRPLETLILTLLPGFLSNSPSEQSIPQQSQVDFDNRVVTDINVELIDTDDTHRRRVTSLKILYPKEYSIELFVEELGLKSKSTTRCTLQLQLDPFFANRCLLEVKPVLHEIHPCSENNMVRSSVVNWQVVPMRVKYVFFVGRNGVGKSLMMTRLAEESCALHLTPSTPIDKEAIEKRYRESNYLPVVPPKEYSDKLAALDDAGTRELKLSFGRVFEGDWKLIIEGTTVSFQRMDEHFENSFAFHEASDGLREVLRMLLYAFHFAKKKSSGTTVASEADRSYRTGPVFLLDEPGVFLHPFVFRSLFHEILCICETLQSPYLVAVATHNFDAIEQCLQRLDASQVAVFEITSSLVENEKPKTARQKIRKSTAGQNPTFNRLASRIVCNAASQRIFTSFKSDTEVADPIADIVYSSSFLESMVGQKPIVLYCEGGLYGKDMKLYSMLFGRHVQVHPIGSCTVVIPVVKSQSKLATRGIRYFGLIDRDRGRRTHKHVAVLGVAEIENLFLDRRLLALYDVLVDPKHPWSSVRAHYFNELKMTITENMEKYIHEYRLHFLMYHDVLRKHLKVNLRDQSWISQVEASTKTYEDALKALAGCSHENDPAYDNICFLNEKCILDKLALEMIEYRDRTLSDVLVERVVFKLQGGELPELWDYFIDVFEKSVEYPTEPADMKPMLLQRLRDQKTLALAGKLKDTCST